MTEPGPKPPEIENLATARFRCVFPVCGGICCRNGRPTVEDAERARLDANLEKLLPHLRPGAQTHIAKHGWLTNRVKGGLREGEQLDAAQKLHALERDLISLALD